MSARANRANKHADIDAAFAAKEPGSNTEADIDLLKEVDDKGWYEKGYEMNDEGEAAAAASVETGEKKRSFIRGIWSKIKNRGDKALKETDDILEGKVGAETGVVLKPDEEKAAVDIETKEKKAERNAMEVVENAMFIKKVEGDPKDQMDTLQDLAKDISEFHKNNPTSKEDLAIYRKLKEAGSTQDRETGLYSKASAAEQARLRALEGPYITDDVLRRMCAGEISWTSNGVFAAIGRLQNKRWPANGERIKEVTSGGGKVYNFPTGELLGAAAVAALAGAAAAEAPKSGPAKSAEDLVASDKDAAAEAKAAAEAREQQSYTEIMAERYEAELDEALQEQKRLKNELDALNDDIDILKNIVVDGMPPVKRADAIRRNNAMIGEYARRYAILKAGEPELRAELEAMSVADFIKSKVGDETGVGDSPEYLDKMDEMYSDAIHGIAQAQLETMRRMEAIGSRIILLEDKVFFYDPNALAIEKLNGYLAMLNSDISSFSAELAKEKDPHSVRARQLHLHVNMLLAERAELENNIAMHGKKQTAETKNLTPEEILAKEKADGEARLKKIADRMAACRKDIDAIRNGTYAKPIPATAPDSTRIDTWESLAADTLAEMEAKNKAAAEAAAAKKAVPKKAEPPVFAAGEDEEVKGKILPAYEIIDAGKGTENPEFAALFIKLKTELDGLELEEQEERKNLEDIVAKIEAAMAAATPEAIEFSAADTGSGATHDAEWSREADDDEPAPAAVSVPAAPTSLPPVVGAAGTLSGAPADRELTDREVARAVESEENLDADLAKFRRYGAEEIDQKTIERNELDKEDKEAVMKKAHELIGGLDAKLLKYGRGKIEDQLAVLKRITGRRRLSEEHFEPLLGLAGYEIAVLTDDDIMALKQELVGKIEAFLKTGPDAEATPETLIKNAEAKLFELREYGIKETTTAAPADLKGMIAKAKARLDVIAKGGSDREALIKGLTGLDALPETGLDKLSDEQLKKLADKRVNDLEAIRDAAQQKLDVLKGTVTPAPDKTIDAPRPKPVVRTVGELSSAAAETVVPAAVETAKPDTAPKPDAGKEKREATEKIMEEARGRIKTFADENSIDELRAAGKAVDEANPDQIGARLAEAGILTAEDAAKLGKNELFTLRNEVVASYRKAIDKKRAATPAATGNAEPKPDVEPKAKPEFDVLFEKGDAVFDEYKKSDLAEMMAITDDGELVKWIEGSNREIDRIRKFLETAKREDVIKRLVDIKILTAEELEKLNDRKLRRLIDRYIKVIDEVKEETKKRRLELAKAPAAAGARLAAAPEAPRPPGKPPEKGDKKLELANQEAGKAVERAAKELNAAAKNEIENIKGIENILITLRGVDIEGYRRHLVVNNGLSEEHAGMLTGSDLERLRGVETFHTEEAYNKSKRYHLKEINKRMSKNISKTDLKTSGIKQIGEKDAKKFTADELEQFNLYVAAKSIEDIKKLLDEVSARP